MKLDELTFVERTLGSGLRAVVVPMPGVHRVVVNAQLRTGPAYEPAEDNGISHFLEHMLYRGTERHPSAHDQADAFESLGGTLSASTYVDHGSMAIAVPVESFDKTLPLFAEVYQQPLFSHIETEKGIVGEEILESLDDDGEPVGADELIRTLCFGDHPLGRPIVGTADNLEAVDRAKLIAYHQALYVGDNTVLCVAGPVDPEHVHAAIARHFQSVAAGRAPSTPPLAAQREPRFRYIDHAGSQTELRVAFRAPPDLHPLEPATDILLRVLDDGMSTRLYHRICDEKGLCYDVSAGYEAYASGGIFDLAAEATHERAEELLAELFTLVGDLRDHGPTDAELDKVRARLGWHFEAMLDDPGELASFMASGILTAVAPRLGERRTQLLSVSKADVRRAAEHIFTPAGMSVLVVGSLRKKERKALERAVLAFG
ncbi:MAG: insulinase family protein [Polyangiaceae bacterium]|nr:insulinase family protein [Polyangiaceae bacterium]